MAEVTKLQALGIWLWREPTVRIIAALALLTAVAGALWINADRQTSFESTPNAAVQSGSQVTAPEESGTPGEAGQTGGASVGGDGVAAGRDLNIEGSVNFR